MAEKPSQPVPTAESDTVTEKPVHNKPAATSAEEEEEDEDIDALIDDLQSEDGNAVDEDDDSDPVSGPRPVPEELLNTDPRVGLTDQEVATRRKRFGLNVLSTYHYQN